MTWKTPTRIISWRMNSLARGLWLTTIGVCWPDSASDAIGRRSRWGWQTRKCCHRRKGEDDGRFSLTTQAIAPSGAEPRQVPFFPYEVVQNPKTAE